MGQTLNLMTQNQSKEELLYQLIRSGNVDAIEALCREGANLEWVDKDGKTPLIIASMDSGLFNVAKILIEMGANVNAYRPGRHAGTPLHHAAKRGVKQTVNLLLSSGANPLVRNDNCQTARDVARMKGYTNVARLIENHICFFSGCLREFYGPGFLEALAPQLLSRKIWVVVLPCGSGNLLKPLRLELAIYSTLQDAQPRTVISLWKAKIEEPKFDQPDPGLTLFDEPTKTRYKFASANKGDKVQLLRLYGACRGITQVMAQPMHHDPQPTIPGIRHQTSAKDVKLAMAISASLQSSMEGRPPLLNSQHRSESINANGWESSGHVDNLNGCDLAVGSSHSVASGRGCMDEVANEDYNGGEVTNSEPTDIQGCVQTHDNTHPVDQASGGITASVLSPPTAPPISDGVLNERPIHYPSIDFGSVDLSIPAIEHEASITGVKDADGSSSCIICWEAPVEGACVPCGHMAGCMAWLTDIKAKKGVCPVCRVKIDKVIRLYAV